MFPLLVALLIFGAVFLFVFALGATGPDVRTRLEGLRRGPVADQGPSGLTMSERMVSPFTGASVHMIQSVLPNAMLEGMRQRLLVAGEPMTVNAFLMLRVLLLATFLLLPVLFLMAGALAVGPLALLLIAVFLILGVMLPQMWLGSRVTQRQNQILKSLPDAFDLITTCVEAGLGLDAALSRVAAKVEGPFAIELQRTLQEISLGRTRRDALKELGERTGVPDLISFVNAVIQAEQMGSSIGTVLRVQAEQLRVRRRQRAEAQAYKAPVKMIFPLVLCIFPALFIVILGPAVITIIQDFPGAK
jgi:tight adherence protein C